MRRARAGVATGILTLALLTGCQQEDTRAQAVLARVDEIASVLVLDPMTADGTMSVSAEKILWSAPSERAETGVFPVPHLPTDGRTVEVIRPRPQDLPNAEDHVILLLAYHAPQWVAVLVGDRDTWAITGTSTRARHAREAVQQGRRLTGAEARSVTIDLVTGARAMADAEAGHGDPKQAGGLMRRVIPHLSKDNGGQG